MPVPLFGLQSLFMMNDDSNLTDPAFLQKASSRIISFEGCEIWFYSGNVVVDSTTPLTDLVLCEFARPRIYFERHCYYVCQKSKSSSTPVTYRYVLTPWPQNDEAATRKVILDEDYFLQLKADRLRDQRDNVAFKVLALFYPFLGFLWSPQKRVLSRIGFEPQAISSISIYVGFMVALLSGAFQVVFLFGAHMFSPTLTSIALIFVVDALARYNRLLIARDQIPPGFYEWLLKQDDIQH